MLQFLQTTMAQLSACKPSELKGLDMDKNGLSRCLNVFDLIAFGLGSCVGAGVFVTTGQIAAFHSGPAVCISFLMAGFAALLSGLCYAEFAARLPIAGSAYSYSYAVLGELAAWVMGWLLCLEYGVSAGTVAVSWSSYVFAAFSNFGVTLPKGIAPVPLGDTVFQINTLALFIVLCVTALLLLGANISAKMNLFITVWNISTISFVIIYGFTLVDSDNWSPFMPFGFDEVLVGGGIAFFSYIGFDAVSSMSAEARNPKRDIPLGLMGTLGIASTLYFLVSFVIAGMVPYTTLQEDQYVDSPISQAFKYAGKDWAASLVAIASCTTLTCTTLCSVLGQPRIFLAMAQDGLLPPALGRVNERKVPVVATLATAVVAGTLAFFFTFDFLSDSISLGTFMAFSFVCAGVLLLRLKYDPERVDAALQPNRRIYRTTFSTIFVAWFGVGSWAAWMIIRNTSSHVAIKVLSMLVGGATPLAGILWLWHTSVLVPPGPTFKAPFMPYLPLLGIFVNGCLMAGLASQSYLNLFIWVSLGLAIYVFYGYHHSFLAANNRNQQDSTQEKDDDANSLNVEQAPPLDSLDEKKIHEEHEQLK